MQPEPDLEALRALVTTVQEGSLTAASRRLGITQQAVSLRVRSLERELDVQLLIRSPRGSRLTPSGELVAGWAVSLLGAADEFTSTVNSLRSERGKSMHVAASLTIAEHLLPEWIGAWREHLGAAGPLVRLTAENSTAVIDEVREGTVDLGFIETPVVPEDLGSRTIGYDRIEVVAQPSHPWAKQGSVSVAELASTALVLRESGSGTRQTFEQALASVDNPRHVEPVAVESTTLGVRSAIIAGTAPGVLSSLAIADDVRSGRLAKITVHGLDAQRPLTVVWAGKTPSADAQSFLRTVANTISGTNS